MEQSDLVFKVTCGGGVPRDIRRRFQSGHFVSAGADQYGASRGSEHDYRYGFKYH